MTINQVFRYGLRAPTLGAERVVQQMRAAHDYRNRLIELERERRSSLRDLDATGCNDLFANMQARAAEVAQMVEEVKRERSRTRKRQVDRDLSLRLSSARAALRDAKRSWREHVRARRSEAESDRDRINEEFLAARRAARPGLRKGLDGVAAGTYQLVEIAVAQSAAAPLWDGAEPNDPRFLRWTGDGCVSQQIGGGASIEEVNGAHTQVRIGGPELADRRSSDSRRSLLRKRVTLWLRVGSTEDRKPVWAKWPMVLHRPLPPDARIQRVTVRLRHIGPRAEWSVEFSLRLSDPVRKRGAAVAMDVGWRTIERSLRIASTCDESGAQSEIRMPAEIVSGLDVPRGLRATRDQNMDAAKAELARWLGERDKPPLDDWVTDATATLAQWRSPARLAALAIRWRSDRVEGDEQAFAALEAWRRQDRHLWLWETSQRTGALRARRDWFRCVAAKIADQYATLVLEKFDLRTVAQRAQVGEDKTENETARSNRVVAAIGEFRQVLRSAFRSRGGEVVEVAAQDTTRTCAECGVVETFDAATFLRHRCVNGHEWDQDANAARNLLARWRGEDSAKTARTPDQPIESRRERTRRLRAEKLLRMGRSKVGADQPMASGGV